MLPGLYELLQRIEPWDEIHKIIPGRMKRTKLSCKITLEVKQKTITGLECLARGENGIQKVFIISWQKDALMQKIRTLTTA